MEASQVKSCKPVKRHWFNQVEPSRLAKSIDPTKLNQARAAEGTGWRYGGQAHGLRASSRAERWLAGTPASGQAVGGRRTSNVL